MNHPMTDRKLGVALFGAVLAALVMAVLPAQHHPADAASSRPRPPRIFITQVPSAAPGEALAEKPLQGMVSRAPAGSRILVFALGDRWYIQPWENRPWVSHQRGRWSTETHGGYEFVVYLVSAAYRLPATIDSLPRVGGEVLAMARATPGR